MRDRGGHDKAGWLRSQSLCGSPGRTQQMQTLMSYSQESGFVLETGRESDIILFFRLGVTSSLLSVSCTEQVPSGRKLSVFHVYTNFGPVPRFSIWRLKCVLHFLPTDISRYMWVLPLSPIKTKGNVFILPLAFFFFFLDSCFSIWKIT